MAPALNLLAVLNLLGVAQGLLMTVALLSMKRGNRFANRLMAAMTITISIVVGGAVLLTTNYVFLYPHLSRVHHPFVFLAGPLLFLYIRALTSRRERLEKRDWLHFVPFVLCLLYLIPYYFQSGALKLQQLTAEYYEDSLGAWYYFRSGMFILQFLVYLILITLTLVKYSRSADRNSEHGKHVLFQVRFFVTASLLLWTGALLRYTLDQSGSTNLLVPFGGSLLVYAMGYMQLSRPPVQKLAEEPQPAAKKYEKSTLLPARSDRYLEKLLRLMEEEKPYLDGELTLQKLAERLSIPAQHLSQVINERLNQSFSDFINSYRVEEAKRRLLDPKRQHYTVLAIAEEVGFNSKSSFNAIFKKYTNTTPSEFRKAMNAAH
ncbi:MAG TPA: helix-turn-helix domain-containing protein [Pyrinomonadaceae bacterium]|nr:helix-turn-helix domain-containing protein [Pyrinomonadaceae bacterium]